MKRKTKSDKRSEPVRVSSGAIGGPGTGRISFQVDVGVSRALQLMLEAALLPLSERYISIEPRSVSEIGTAAWDIGLKPDDENVEVKYSPTRKDVEEWLQRIAHAGSGSSVSRFTLVYNKGSNGLLRCVEQMRRIALECRNEGEEKFRSLVEAEGIAESEKIYSLLGENTYKTLQQIGIELIPESVLQNNILTTTRVLAGIDGGKQLYRLLFDRFSHAVSGRLTFSIAELLEEAEANHIKIHVPPAPASSYYDPSVISTLFLLQKCVTGVPIDVVATAVNSDRESLRRMLEAPLRDGKIIETKDNWFVVGVPRLACDGGEDILARALAELLRFIESHNMDELAYSQIHNAVALAKECAVVRPRAVVPVFHTLDKLLKRTGDIHLVLDVAHLTIGAAKRVEPRGRDEAEAVAISLICGVSWAYQRMPGHLDDARSAYVDSREIAQNIDDKLTLAYINKCLGRLCRLEAEQVDVSREVKESRLRESIQLLQDAIERFDALGGHTHEIADCHSLIARTYLNMREFAKVEESMRKAYSLMDNHQSKDYADLLILTGDLEAQRRNYSSAYDSYNKVLDSSIDGGAETSEIRARALRQRGLCLVANGKLHDAKTSLLQAAAIWDKLDQHENAAAARWDATIIDHDFPLEALRLLEKESPSVRMEFAELHLSRINKRASKKAHVSSREQQDKGYFERLIKQAREQNAIKNLNE